MSDGPAAHRIHPQDDVAVALRDLAAGEPLRIGAVTATLRQPVPRGHKLALAGRRTGEPVRKYGASIGVALADIAAGDHVHVHNLGSALRGEEAYAYAPTGATAARAEGDARTFDGYLRADGRVGTRNEVWVLPTVGCIARTAQRIAAVGHARFGGRGGLEGVRAFTHPHGCSQLGDDLDGVRAILAGLARNPNAGGVLLVGLGCENNQLDALLASAPDLDRSRVRAFAAQESGDELEEGLAAVEALAALAEQDRRTPSPLSALAIGLKCGGSDGLSGLTANPLVGAIADRLAAAGGRPMLTEIPELFGAERPLLDRAVSTEVFARGVEVLNGFKRYFLEHGQPVHENPSPGNKAGGVTTLEEKSLGAAQKAGRAPLAQVLRYGEPLGPAPGLALVKAPGNDAVSCTALAAAGATMILFTTGRGTPLGFPAPTLKIATNTPLAERKPGWIDFDAGPVLTEGLPALSGRLMSLILATASGRPTRAELNDEREIAIWKRGVTL